MNLTVRENIKSTISAFVNPAGLAAKIAKRIIIGHTFVCVLGSVTGAAVSRFFSAGCSCFSCRNCGGLRAPRP